MFNYRNSDVAEVINNRDIKWLEFIRSLGTKEWMHAGIYSKIVAEVHKKVVKLDSATLGKLTDD